MSLRRAPNLDVLISQNVLGSCKVPLLSGSWSLQGLQTQDPGSFLTFPPSVQGHVASSSQEMNTADHHLRSGLRFVWRACSLVSLVSLANYASTSCPWVTNPSLEECPRKALRYEGMAQISGLMGSPVSEGRFRSLRCGSTEVEGQNGRIVHIFWPRGGTTVDGSI